MTEKIITSRVRERLITETASMPSSDNDLHFSSIGLPNGKKGFVQVWLEPNIFLFAIKINDPFDPSAAKSSINKVTADEQETTTNLKIRVLTRLVKKRFLPVNYRPLSGH